MQGLRGLSFMEFVASKGRRLTKGALWGRTEARDFGV